MTADTGKSLRKAGTLATAAGSMFTIVGIGAWFAVTQQLGEEKIVVPRDAPVFAGRQVKGPATAFVQALVIKRHSERGAGGRTFADITKALSQAEEGSDEQRDLRAKRTSLSTAASLRTSLMTSVLAYGVSAFAAGLGALLVMVGRQLRRS